MSDALKAKLPPIDETFSSLTEVSQKSEESWEAAIRIDEKEK